MYEHSFMYSYLRVCKNGGDFVAISCLPAYLFSTQNYERFMVMRRDLNTCSMVQHAGEYGLCLCKLNQHERTSTRTLSAGFRISA